MWPFTSGKKTKLDTAPKKVKLAKPKLSQKQIATEKGEPYISVVSFESDANDPRLGAFELDWNEHFIRKLREIGYPGVRDEEVVDIWFQDVCRNIVLETYEQDQANNSSVTPMVRYVNRRNLGDGKSEVS